MCGCAGASRWGGIDTMTRATVLLAEDDEPINDMLSDFLAAQGYRVVSTFDGTEAISALHDAAYDCAVVDLMMPGADGTQVIAAMDDVCPDLVGRTIIISAYPNGFPAARRTQVAAVLQKPFEIDELGQEVDRCVRLAAS
jgi:DNA-binding NtrC family response regulator